jgi:hypothetical protein
VGQQKNDRIGTDADGGLFCWRLDQAYIAPAVASDRFASFREHVWTLLDTNQSSVRSNGLLDRGEPVSCAAADVEDNVARLQIHARDGPTTQALYPRGAAGVRNTPVFFKCHFSIWCHKTSTQKPILTRVIPMLQAAGHRIPKDDITAGVRFFVGLPSFLRHKLSLDEARTILARRLERREDDFLALARDAIYAQPTSPYRELLRFAGCLYGDLEQLVRREGLEAALAVLYHRGVYLTVEEFKGRHPAVRGSSAVAISAALVKNPFTSTHLWSRSGGSRGEPTQTAIDFTHVRDRAVNEALALDARGGLGWTHAAWMPPGSWAIKHVLHHAVLGLAPPHWFSQVDPAAPGLAARYRWSTQALKWGSRLARVDIRGPEHVPLEDPLPIAHWIARLLRAGRTPHLHTFTSSAVHLCQGALDAGLDLSGAQITTGAEPVTSARLAAIRRSGAWVIPSYGSEEAGAIGRGCMAPQTADDVHLLHDLNAVISAEQTAANRELAPNTLLFTSLRRTASWILLNVSLGDQAVMTRRACDCPLERLGWDTHLEQIGSFEKLTTGGMNVLDGDVVRVLEEVLPARFGGGPTDYQLLEEEVDQGRARLRLLVHPRLGPLDGTAVAQTFLAAVGTGAGPRRITGLIWGDADVVDVERQPPLATGAGKILHVHLKRHSPSGSASRR